MVSEIKINIPKAKPPDSSTPVRDLFRTTPVEVQSTHTSELVFGLCGPIGSPLHEVAHTIRGLLVDKFGYQACEIIRLSNIIEEFKGSAPKSSRFDRIKWLIDKGNELRQAHGNSMLADIAISKIAKDREAHRKKTGTERFAPRRVCHIIDSIKNQEELDALRLVYRDMFYFMGVFAPMPFRQSRLQKEMSLTEVYQLIDQDSGEEFDYGQTVRNTFPHADFFLRVDSDTMQPRVQKLERFLDIIFSTEVITPSVAETAMHLAASAAGNSACLSRQVGAALTDSEGEPIAVGWNDVPKADGGLYQTNSNDPMGKDDHRCYHRGGGYCSNDEEKNLLATTITESLIAKDVISDADKNRVIEVIRDSKIRELIEFSRSVHAEMQAIIAGSQLGGDRVRGGKLYSTVYPCHSCARHIILAGISEVYYIEPYRKSLAIKLHDDAITEIESETKKVRILPFDGVAPERYLELFRMAPNSRKNRLGKKSLRSRKDASPKSEVTMESLPALEGLVVQRLITNKILKIEEPENES